MGSQQLLMVLVGVIIIGIAIMVGVGMFKSSAEDAVRNAIKTDLIFFAQKAREYYWKPTMLGGGNKTFSDITLSHLTNRPDHIDRYFSIESKTSDEVVLLGIGKVIAGTDSIRIRIRVNERQNQLETLN
ncbi:MAG: hypothetical protein WD295_05810 [Bacteroidota bacterium]